MRWVERKEALEHCQLFNDSDYRILLIEAQAGQGKTILATQYVEQVGTPFSWVACDEQDVDAILLLEKLLNAIKESNSVFNIEAVLQSAYRSSLSPDTLDLVLARIRHEFEQIDACPFIFVVDDIHLLKDSSLSLQLIGKLPEMLNHSADFIFISRFPLYLEEERLFPTSHAIIIDNDLLAFSHSEIATLYSEMLGEPITTNAIRNLRESTDGWIAGLMMLSQQRRTISLKKVSDSPDFMDFFSLELLGSASNELQDDLQLASILTEIPIDFLLDHSYDDLADWLEQLCRKNFFVKIAPGRGAIYRLHHLFQDALRKSAMATIAPVQRQLFLRQAALWLEDAGQVEKGLQCWITAEDWEGLEKALGRTTPQLLAQGRQKVLYQLFESVPEEFIKGSGWISFISGWTSFHIAPAESHTHLSKAQAVFQESGQPVGEMMALGLLISHCIITTREFRKNKWMVYRLTALFQDLQNVLPASLVAFCAHSLVVGYTYFLTDYSTATKYKKLVSVDSGGGVDTWYGSIMVDSFSGNNVGSMDQLERCFTVVNDPWATPMERLVGKVLQCNFLQMRGMSVNFNLLSGEIFADSGVLENATSLAWFLRLWQLDLTLAADQFPLAETLITQLDFDESASVNSHIFSLICQYKALQMALTGQHDKVQSVAMKCLKHRARAGSLYFMILNKVTIGAALIQGANIHAGERMLQVALSQSKRIGEAYNAAVAHGYLAAHYISNDRMSEALPQMTGMAATLRVYENRHGFGWNNKHFLPVFQAAVKHDVDPALFRELARTKNQVSIMDDGTVVPLLRVTIREHMELSCGEVVADFDLSPIMEQLIVTLCLAPGMKMQIDEIAERIWPETPASKVRNNLDRLLSRIRSLFRNTFGDITGQSYLIFEKGTLRLAHCEVGVLEALNCAEKGARFDGEGKLWQAHHAYELMEYHLGDLENIPPQIRGQIAKAALSWSKVMIQGHMHKRALSVVEKVLAFDPTDDQLQRTRYHLLNTLNLPAKALKARRDYENKLKADGFSKKEIHETFAIGW